MTSPGSAKSLSPNESETLVKVENIHDEEPDETWQERLAGLVEMVTVPAEFRTVGKFLCSSFTIICEASWIVFATFAILMGPVIYETERQRVNEAFNENENDNNAFEKIIK